MDIDIIDVKEYPNLFRIKYTAEIAEGVTRTFVIKVRPSAWKDGRAKNLMRIQVDKAKKELEVVGEIPDKDKPKAGLKVTLPVKSVLTVPKGVLTTEQSKALETFLKEHPDIKTKKGRKKSGVV